MHLTWSCVRTRPKTAANSMAPQRSTSSRSSASSCAGPVVPRSTASTSAFSAACWRRGALCRSSSSGISAACWRRGGLCSAPDESQRARASASAACARASASESELQPARSFGDGGGGLHGRLRARGGAVRGAVRARRPDVGVHWAGRDHALSSSGWRLAGWPLLATVRWPLCRLSLVLRRIEWLACCSVRATGALAVVLRCSWYWSSSSELTRDL